jgi:hypothetical protein
VRRSLYLITLGSWLAAPFALGVAHVYGFVNSPQVVVYLLLISTQAPFLIILNESLAPAFVKIHLCKLSRFALLSTICLSLFISCFISLSQLSIIFLTSFEVLFSSFLSVCAALISYKSSLRIVKGITRDHDFSSRYLILFFLGSLPSFVVFVVFLIFALFRDVFSDYFLFFLVPSLLLPNLLHFMIGSFIFSDSFSNVGDNLVGSRLSLRSYLVVIIICVLLPFNIAWGNDLRVYIGSFGSVPWILLFTNMLFTSILVVSKVKFLESIGSESIKLSFDFLMILSFLLLFFLSFYIKFLGFILPYSFLLLILSFLITIFAVNLCRAAVLQK